jgi:LmbE family N-acetylglucosaminyl deacetylase
MVYNNFANYNVLVLAPHTDDAELGCGGTMARFLRTGANVYVAAFSTAEDSLPESASQTMLRDEFLAAMRQLGIPEERIFIYGYRVRHLSYHRQEVLEEMVVLRAKVNPHLILLPSDADVHQDHQVINAEGLRAFKERSIWGYELPWNHITFSAQAFVTLDQCDLDAKWNALQNYHSQIELKRPYFTREFVAGLARVRGVQVKAEYAEAFQVFRQVVSFEEFG